MTYVDNLQIYRILIKCNGKVERMLLKKLVVCGERNIWKSNSVFYLKYAQTMQHMHTYVMCVFVFGIATIIILTITLIGYIVKVGDYGSLKTNF